MRYILFPISGKSLEFDFKVKPGKNETVAMLRT